MYINSHSSISFHLDLNDSGVVLSSFSNSDIESRSSWSSGVCVVMGNSKYKTVHGDVCIRHGLTMTIVF